MEYLDKNTQVISKAVIPNPMLNTYVISIVIDIFGEKVRVVQEITDPVIGNEIRQNIIEKQTVEPIKPKYYVDL